MHLFIIMLDHRDMLLYFAYMEYDIALNIGGKLLGTSTVQMEIILASTSRGRDIRSLCSFLGDSCRELDSTYRKACTVPWACSSPGLFRPGGRGPGAFCWTVRHALSPDPRHFRNTQQNCILPLTDRELQSSPSLGPGESPLPILTPQMT